MAVHTPESVILHCVIEEQVFYYGIVKDKHVIQADGIRINSDFNFFRSPQVIIDFLAKSFNIETVTSTHVAIANTNYSLIPDIVSDKDSIHWITHQNTDTQNYHVDHVPGLKVGYHISGALENALRSSLPHTTFYHVMSTNLSGDHKQNGVYSYPINGLQFIQLVEDHKTQYGNLVSSKSTLSRLYFSLLPYHLHQKDTMTLPLYTTPAKTNNLVELKTYIKQVNTLQPSLTVVSDSPLSEEQVYQIEKLTLCAS